MSMYKLTCKCFIEESLYKEYVLKYNSFLKTCSCKTYLIFHMNIIYKIFNCFKRGQKGDWSKKNLDLRNFVFIQKYNQDFTVLSK